MPHIILHDNRGTHIVTNTSGQHRLIFLHPSAKWSNYDKLSRLLFTITFTDKEPDVMQHSPIAVRYSITNGVGFETVYVAELIPDRQPLNISGSYSWTLINDALLARLQPSCLPKVIDAIRNIPEECVPLPSLPPNVHMRSTHTIPWFAMCGYVQSVRSLIQSQLNELGLEMTGSVRQLSSGPDSMNFVVDTCVKSVFYKVSGQGSDETVFTRALARLMPEYVVAPFFVDEDRNAFYTENFGNTFARFLNLITGDNSEQNRMLCREELVQRIAFFQQEMEHFVDNLTSKDIGMEDTSPRTMLDRLPEVLLEFRHVCTSGKGDDDAKLKLIVPTLQSALITLVNGKIPSTVCHGDLHSWNVTEPSDEDEMMRLFDWYECSISHPFLDMLSGMMSEPEFRPLQNEYIAQWEAYASFGQLQELWKAARVVLPLWEMYRLLSIHKKSRQKLHRDELEEMCCFSFKRLLSTLTSISAFATS